MNCREFLNRHSEYVDARVAAAEAALLRSHAEACASCARYDRVVRKGAQLARELLPRIEVSEDFEPRVRHRLLHVRDEVARRRAGSASLYAAATVVLIAAVAGAALTLPGASVSVVDAAPVWVAAPPALTPASGALLAAASGPALPLERLDDAPPVIASIEPQADVRDPHAASPAGWPVYSRSAMAVAFPGAHTSLVVNPADFSRAVPPRRAAGPLLVRH